MSYTILDCYTDEAAGLGVPPYLGTYPRYIYGMLKNEGNSNINYLTIDDLRSLTSVKKKRVIKTNIKTYNVTRSISDVKKVLSETETLIIILGVHVPGKYLSALPGTLKEVQETVKNLNCKKILTGPVLYGTQLEGGKFFEKINKEIFDEIKLYKIPYNKLGEIAELGAEIVSQIPLLRIMEIETGQGCNVGRCSFCTEPLKNKVEYRQNKDVLSEIKKLYSLGQRYFRLGKQTCFYSYPECIDLLKSIHEECPDIKVLHIDNVNPIFVSSKKGIEITKAVVKYCTPGNIAAFGVESFDPEVTRKNTLNCSSEIAMKAIRTINKYGSERGSNGMPKFLPGINIIFGLLGETKKTHEFNMKYLKQVLDENLLLRRINIRQVAIFEGTSLFMASKEKYLFKNKKFYWKWRKEIREKIDYEMLQRLVPSGSVMKNIRMEVYDGNNTFGRQMGTYPLIVGIKKRLEIGKFYDIKVKSHMLRSIVGEPFYMRGTSNKV
jgi:radical SAM superfamily enzyme with C-terminal helix-hairpin-helix motif